MLFYWDTAWGKHCIPEVGDSVLKEAYHFRCQSQAHVFLSALLTDQLAYVPLWIPLLFLRNSLNAEKYLLMASGLL
jgi:hypothetical protein